MSEIPADRYDHPGRYEIRLKGHLDARWAAWFDGLTVTQGSDGTTVIHGPVADQAALHGLLKAAAKQGTTRAYARELGLSSARNRSS